MKIFKKCDVSLLISKYSIGRFLRVDESTYKKKYIK